MNFYAIFSMPMASRRYQVTACIPITYPERTIEREPDAHTIRDDRIPIHELAIASPRPFRVGCIINPTKVIRQLIEARKKGA